MHGFQKELDFIGQCFSAGNKPFSSMEKPAEEMNGQWHRFVDVSASQECCAYVYPYT